MGGGGAWSQDSEKKTGFQALNAYSLLDALWNSGYSTVWAHCFWQVWYINCSRNNFYSAASPQNHRAGLRGKKREEKRRNSDPGNPLTMWLAELTSPSDWTLQLSLASSLVTRGDELLPSPSPPLLVSDAWPAKATMLPSTRNMWALSLMNCTHNNRKFWGQTNLRDWKRERKKEKKKKHIETNGKTTTDWVAGIRWSFKQTNKNTNKQKALKNVLDRLYTCKLSPHPYKSSRQRTTMQTGTYGHLVHRNYLPPRVNMYSCRFCPVLPG